MTKYNLSLLLTSCAVTTTMIVAQPSVTNQDGIPLHYLGEGKLRDKNINYYTESSRKEESWYNPNGVTSGGTIIEDAVGTTVTIDGTSVTIQNSAQGCHDYCYGTYGTENALVAPLGEMWTDLVGFSFCEDTGGSCSAPSGPPPGGRNRIRGRRLQVTGTDNACYCYRQVDAANPVESLGSWRYQLDRGDLWCMGCLSGEPSGMPSSMPSSLPSSQPSSEPSSSSRPSSADSPSSQPSSRPSSRPSSSGLPSSQPSSQLSSSPSSQPSSQPSEFMGVPSGQPSESPSANPSQGCENIRTDCGWGIFNPWTCRCDCPVGICLDHNEQCYHPCRETINTNPWAGCSPGWDCPWFPTDDSVCKSELHQPNNFEIYRTAGQCCEAHFSGSQDCVNKSMSPHIRTVGDELHLRSDGGHPVGSGPYPWPIHFPDSENARPFAPPEAQEHWMTESSHKVQWFPDLINKLNCVKGRNYENWMQEDGFDELYLFNTPDDCCEKWYPGKSDCPDYETPVNPEAEDEPWYSDPYSVDNYFFPDFGVNNCGYGRDYPAWMGHSAFEKHYLFRQGSECCERFYPGKSGCPYERTEQLDYYWTSYENNLPNSVDMPIVYNHTYFPDIFSRPGTCVNGTNYPDWMSSDVDFKRLYLFKTLDGCCEHWFTNHGLEGCKNNVIQGFYNTKPCPTNRPECNHIPIFTNTTLERLTMWYVDVDGQQCKQDGNMEKWMLNDDYAEWYLFHTKEQCCAAFGNC